MVLAHHLVDLDDVDIGTFAYSHECCGRRISWDGVEIMEEDNVSLLPRGNGDDAMVLVFLS